MIRGEKRRHMEEAKPVVGCSEEETEVRSYFLGGSVPLQTGQ